MGTSIEDVVAFIDNKDDWGSANIIEGGFLHRPSGKPPVIIGETTVTARLGSYRAWYILLGLPEVNASAKWDFDEDGKLIHLVAGYGWSP